MRGTDPGIGPGERSGRRSILNVALTSVLLIASISTADLAAASTECPGLSIAGHADRGDDLFVGELVAVEPTREHGVQPQIFRVTIDVTKVYRGTVDKRVVIATAYAGGCGIRVPEEEGEFGFVIGNGMDAGTLTSIVEAEDMRALFEGFPPPESDAPAEVVVSHQFADNGLALLDGEMKIAAWIPQQSGFWFSVCPDGRHLAVEQFDTVDLVDLVTLETVDSWSRIRVADRPRLQCDWDGSAFTVSWHEARLPAPADIDSGWVGMPGGDFGLRTDGGLVIEPSIRVTRWETLPAPLDIEASGELGPLLESDSQSTRLLVDPIVIAVGVGALGVILWRARRRFTRRIGGPSTLPPS